MEQSFATLQEVIDQYIIPKLEAAGEDPGGYYLWEIATLIVEPDGHGGCSVETNEKGFWSAADQYSHAALYGWINS